MNSFNDLKINLSGYAGIADDSRKVKTNYIFVTVKGGTVDGAKYIPQAIEKGATVVVGEEEQNLPVPYIKVSDSREALGELASEFYGNPSKKLKVIGVTGTKGKTTTVHIISHILNTLGKKAGLVSSNMAKVGDVESPIGFHVTSPDVISLHRFLNEMVEAGCVYAVIEVSSHGIDQNRIAGVDFEVGVLTNIAPEHLDYHKTFEEYKRVKMSFIESCKHQVIASEITELEVLPGKFNNLNLEVALKAVEFMGIGKEEALNTMKSFNLPEGRLEEIENNLGFRIFIDFAHTPESLEAALEHLRTLTKGKLIVVFGSAGERDAFKRPKMGKVASEMADTIILTAEDPRSENVNDIIAQIKGGIEDGKLKVYEEPDRTKAIKNAIGLAKKGDLVGIFGKGHEKSMNLDGVHEIPWSDRKVVREYID